MMSYGDPIDSIIDRNFEAAYSERFKNELPVPTRRLHPSLRIEGDNLLSRIGRRVEYWGALRRMKPIEARHLVKTLPERAERRLGTVIVASMLSLTAATGFTLHSVSQDANNKPAPTEVNTIDTP